MNDSSPHTDASSSRRSDVRLWPVVCLILICGGSLLLVQSGFFSFTRRPSVDVIYIVLAFHCGSFVWLLGFSRISAAGRSRVLLAAAAIDLSVGLAIRVDGYAGDGRFILTWRWTPTPEERFELSRRERESANVAIPSDAFAATAKDYPSFRGADRTGTVTGIKLDRDWETLPPKLLWRQPVGQGWSAFAVVGRFCVTQEQRSEFESVVCYEVSSGRECWVHRDRVRFNELTGGPGPRATPTIADGRVYALGATGILNCLEGGTGESIWSVNILDDAGAKNRLFGMAGSPLVMGQMVVVSPGAAGNSLVAYDRWNGNKLWGGGNAAASYSSPHPCTIAGRRQILNFNADGLSSHNAADGRVLWSIPWISQSEERNNVCQPIVLPSATADDMGRVFVSSGYRQGCAVFDVNETDDEFSVRERWRNRNLNSKFASVVVRDGCVYGLDGVRLVCVDLQTGERRWRGAIYGHGQLILVDDLLLIQGESGEIALVNATPMEFKEVARFQALDDRTWNHPALSGNRLFVRNDREAACYELPLLAE